MILVTTTQYTSRPRETTTIMHIMSKHSKLEPTVSPSAFSATYKT